eukprot:scaffold2603_cov225-Pinguiococcus_pyrenoidosus.AAC.3
MQTDANGCKRMQAGASGDDDIEPRFVGTSNGLSGAWKPLALPQHRHGSSSVNDTDDDWPGLVGMAMSVDASLRLSGRTSAAADQRVKRFPRPCIEERRQSSARRV